MICVKYNPLTTHPIYFIHPHSHPTTYPLTTMHHPSLPNPINLDPLVRIVGVVALNPLIVHIHLQKVLFQGSGLEIILGVPELPLQEADNHPFFAHPAHVVLQIGQPSALTHHRIINFGCQMQKTLLFGL